MENSPRDRGGAILQGHYSVPADETAASHMRTHESKVDEAFEQQLGVGATEYESHHNRPVRPSFDICYEGSA